MYIERLQVEREGFLAGADIEFSPGLNVIIGARGTGKTSIIELIRFCLASGGFTEDAVQRGNQQATAILQGGAVTVSTNGPDGRQAFIRSANGHLTATAAFPPPCTVLAQSEVEAVGARAAGRLHLIDRFSPTIDAAKQEMELLALELESLTSQVLAVLAEGANLAQQVNELSALRDELAAARKAQQDLLVRAQATDADRSTLMALEESSNVLAARGTMVTSSLDEISGLASDLARLREGTWITVSHTSAPSDLPDVITARQLVSSAFARISAAEVDLDSATARLRAVLQSDDNARRSADERSRHLRQSLDAMQSGVSVASRRVQELEERLGQLTALTERLRERRAKFDEVTARRDASYEQLDALRDDIFAERSQIAETLNRDLGPQIRVRVLHSERTSDYQSAIVRALRGTGMHYNSLAPLIARKVSPFELVTWSERGNVQELMSALDLSRERAISLVSAIRQSGSTEIISSRVEDEITLELLDGREYKPSDRLSIGQRCTVVLPVLLGQHGDPLLVDQPEDHLDNAFIVSTLVTALRRRKPQDQFIFTSHNANIPVLAEADRVIVLESDGDLGYVAASGPLGDPTIVNAVTRIMEGGRDAFAARSRFYAQDDRT